jgi:3-oxoacyl-[acyl-carrier protein] reductase
VAFKKNIVGAVPLGRMADASEVATWFLNLSDSSAGWVTGAIVAVDGGMGA